MNVFRADLHHKVAQLSNDVTDIYTMLGTVQETLKNHGKRLDRIDGRLDILTSQVAILVAALDR